MSARPRRLEGRCCLAVGGTSGIGLETARRFLEEGARVAVAGLDGADAVADALKRLGPCAGWPANATRADEVGLLFERALAFLGGRLDVLFHVAGISGRKYGDGPLHECTDDAWDTVMEGNARATFQTNRAAVQVMLAQERDAAGHRGTVTNVGSVLARRPSPGLFGTCAYAASKGAVEALTRAAAAWYAPEGIRFNLLVPGLIDTPMAARAVGDPRIRDYLTAKQPLSGGPGSAEDCAEAALFLCEPAARFVTGAVLVVDGGWSVSEGPASVEGGR